MAWTTQVFMYCLMACTLQGGSALRPEDVQGTSPETSSAAEEALDRALAGATAAQKQKLVDFHQAQASLQSSADSVSRMGEEIENEVADANMSEDEKFDALEKHTTNVLNLFQGLKSLKAARENLNIQKREGIQVLQDLGLKQASTETRQASQDEALDNALAKATETQKAQLMDYREDQLSFQKAAEALSSQGQQFVNAAALDDFASKSSDEKFDSFEKDTAKMMELFQGLKSLKFAGEKIKEKKQSAINVLQDLGLKSESTNKL